MRTFLNHIKNETLDEIKTSLENLWQQMIQLSESFQYSFVLLLKRKCLVRASRVRSGESGTPSTIIYVRWNSRRYELGCDTPVVHRQRPVAISLLIKWQCLSRIRYPFLTDRLMGGRPINSCQIDSANNYKTCLRTPPLSSLTHWSLVDLNENLESNFQANFIECWLRYLL